MKELDYCKIKGQTYVSSKKLRENLLFPLLESTLLYFCVISSQEERDIFPSIYCFKCIFNFILEIKNTLIWDEAVDMLQVGSNLYHGKNIFIILRSYNIFLKNNIEMTKKRDRPWARTVSRTKNQNLWNLTNNAKGFASFALQRYTFFYYI